MSEPKPIYTTESSKLIFELIKHSEFGEIRRVRLPNGLGLALVVGDNDYGGILTISRVVAGNMPTDREMKRVLSELKEAFSGVGRPVLLFKKLFAEMSVDGCYYVVRFAVYFGEQGRLFN